MANPLVSTKWKSVSFLNCVSVIWRLNLVLAQPPNHTPRLKVNWIGWPITRAAQQGEVERAAVIGWAANFPTGHVARSILTFFWISLSLSLARAEIIINSVARPDYYVTVVWDDEIRYTIDKLRFNVEMERTIILPNFTIQICAR